MDTMPSNDSRATAPTPAIDTNPLYPPVGCTVTYLRTAGGPLKIIEIILDVAILICVGCAPVYERFGGAYVNFVAVLTLAISLLLLIFHMTNLIYRFYGPWILIELIAYVISATLHLISLIVSAVTASKYAYSWIRDYTAVTTPSYYYWIYPVPTTSYNVTFIQPAVISAAVFAGIASLAYGMDAIFQFLLLRKHGGYLISPTRQSDQKRANSAYEVGGVPEDPVLTLKP